MVFFCYLVMELDMHIYINLTRPPSHLLTWVGILATSILYAPASFANANEDVHACQGLLYDMRADNRTTVFIEDLTLVTPSNGLAFPQTCRHFS